MSLFICVLFICLLAMSFAVFNYFKVKSLEEGTDEMSEIALAIRIGADTFLLNEYKVLIAVVLILIVLFSVFISIQSGISLLIGSTMSGLAGLFGMKMATYANVRVSNVARQTESIGKSSKVALRGSSIMGLSVASFSLIGLAIVFFLFKYQLSQMYTVANWCNIEFVPFSMSLASYSFGCSIIAIFNRVGGGIYTKAADTGADLVGKAEENIPEDDPRNPAVIADCVGDNVGDTAGLGSDLLESNVGGIVSAIILIISIFISYKAKGISFSEEMFQKLYMYPIVFASIGLISCVVGIAYALYKKDGKDPHRELNIATWLSAGLTGVLNLVYTIISLRGQDLGDLPFKMGIFSPWVSSVIGIVSGILIGAVAEYYTSYDYKPTKKIAEVSKEGTPLTIVQGMSSAMKSTMLSLLILGIGFWTSQYVSGIFGAAMAAVGMLSFVGITVSVDTYGPICDNAGGIAEMANLGENIRSITDKLDSVGNTTAAIGKGFAIGSASYATFALMISFLYSFTPIDAELSLNLLNAETFTGVLIGGAISYYFSGLLIDAVCGSAKKMVDEVRRQFREIPGLRAGNAKPDYKKCIEIATNGALSEMRKPALIAILVPVVSGFIMGSNFVAGILLGATLSAILLAIYCGNSGGAWDNSKKYIESLGRKGFPEHIAAVVGDTVGDPLKDTVGPSLDILIKIMSTISLIAVSIFDKYNLLSALTNLFK